MSNRTQPLTAVLLPAYQAEAFIQGTLDSITAQTSNDFHVIVSVDQCSDATYEICMAQAARDTRFRVFQQSKRLGYVGNCNFLLSQAQTDFALFAFHDDILSPGYVATLAGVLSDRPGASMSFSDLDLTNIDGQQEHWQFTELEGLTSRTARGLKMLARPQGWWVPNRGMFRMSAARRVQGVKTHGAGEFSVDWPWLFHLSLVGEFVRVPETLCFKYYKTGSLSRTWNHTTHQWFAASVSCMREIWMSDLTGDEKLTLAQPLMDWLTQNRPQNFLAKPQ